MLLDAAADDEAPDLAVESPVPALAVEEDEELSDTVVFVSVSETDVELINLSKCAQ